MDSISNSVLYPTSFQGMYTAKWLFPKDPLSSGKYPITWFYCEKRQVSSHLEYVHTYYVCTYMFCRH